MRRLFATLPLVVLLCGCLGLHPPEGSPLAITLQTDGNWVRSTQVWTAGDVRIGVSDARLAVYQFEGLPTAYVQGTLATAFELVLPQLQVTALSEGTVVTAYAVVSRHADPASGATIGNYLLVELASQEPPVYPTAAADWTISGSTALGATMAERLDTGSEGRAAAFNQAWRSSYRDSNNDLARTILIVLKVTAGPGVVFGETGTATLSVTETTDRTGATGSQYVRDWDKGIASGMVECPKTGIEFARDEAVMDGYLRQLVHPSAYDPPLPRSKARRPYTGGRRGGPQ